MMRKRKRGYVQDILFFGIIVFIVALIVLVGSRLKNDISDNYKDRDVSDLSKDIMEKNVNKYSNIFNWIFFSIFILFAIAIFVTVFMLDTHPVLFFVILIVFAFIMIVMGIMGNAYDHFSTHEDIASETSDLNILDKIMDNWLIWVLVIGFIAITLLLSRFKGS